MGQCDSSSHECLHFLCQTHSALGFNARTATYVEQMTNTGARGVFLGATAGYRDLMLSSARLVVIHTSVSTWFVRRLKSPVEM